LAVDKEIDNVLQIIPKDYLIQMQLDLIGFISNNVKKNKIKLNEKLERKIVIGIPIEYSDLVKMIKNNSFEKWKKMWEKDKEINTIWLQDSISAEKRPYIMKYKIRGGLKK